MDELIPVKETELPADYADRAIEFLQHRSDGVTMAAMEQVFLTSDTPMHDLGGVALHDAYTMVLMGLPEMRGCHIYDDPSPIIRKVLAAPTLRTLNAAMVLCVLRLHFYHTLRRNRIGFPHVIAYETSASLVWFQRMLDVIEFSRPAYHDDESGDVIPESIEMPPDGPPDWVH